LLYQPQLLRTCLGALGSASATDFLGVSISRPSDLSSILAPPLLQHSQHLALALLLASILALALLLALVPQWEPLAPLLALVPQWEPLAPLLATANMLCILARQGGHNSGHEFGMGSMNLTIAVAVPSPDAWAD
jgi:hypothetical protein